MKIFTLKKEESNSEFDITDVWCNMKPTFVKSNDYNFPELFEIKKLTFLIYNDQIKEIYLHGIHPKVDLNSCLFKTNRYKNKKLVPDVIKEIKYNIENGYKEYFNDEFRKMINSIKLKTDDDILSYFFNKNLINKKELDKDIYEIRTSFKPEQLMDEKNNHSYIKNINSSFIIERLRIFTIENKIEDIHIDALHPNCDPLTRFACLPPWMYNQNILEFGFSSIIEILKFYFLRNPHFYLNKEFITCQNY